jgi:hypothetical protein
MNLPLAVVERWPLDEYKEKYPDSIVDALKHSVNDALLTYYELENLKTQFRDSTAKEDRRWNKQLDLTIREKEARLFRLIKFSDYPAMVMAAYSESKFISSHDYKRTRDSILNSILIRGIKAGDHIKHATNTDRDFYFIETGYLGNYPSKNNTTGRKIYHRIEKNSMQQTRILDVPDDRWKELCKFNSSLEYNGWRKNQGSKILLIMSTEKPFQFYNQSRQEWIDTTIATLKKHSDREIVIREKAGRGERTNDTVYNAFDKDIYAVVTYNSIAAVEAIQAGIPAFSCAHTAASIVSTADLTRIENPVKPSEDIIYKWLNSIAYGQFSLNEILTGKAWQLVQENDSIPTFNY